MPLPTAGTIRTRVRPYLLRTGLTRASEFRREQWRMIATALSFVTFSKVDGDYLEFGVYEGESVIHAWDEARRHGRHGMRFYAFDSFSGLPDPATSGVDTGGEFEKTQFYCDRPTFEGNLRRAGVDLSRVRIVEGFYEDTLSGRTPGQLGVDAAAVVWIDCDLYSSTVLALDFVTDVLQDGSILVFDDWHCFHSHPERGEQRACSEWLERNPDIRLVPYRDFHWAGRSFVVNRTGEHAPDVSPGRPGR